MHLNCVYSYIDCEEGRGMTVMSVFNIKNYLYIILNLSEFCYFRGTSSH